MRGIDSDYMPSCRVEVLEKIKHCESDRCFLSTLIGESFGSCPSANNIVSEVCSMAAMSLIDLERVERDEEKDVQLRITDLGIAYLGRE